MYPGLHRQEKDSPVEKQLPLLRHGDVEHGSTFSSQNEPTKPDKDITDTRESRLSQCTFIKAVSCSCILLTEIAKAQYRLTKSDSNKVRIKE